MKFQTSKSSTSLSSRALEEVNTQFPESAAVFVTYRDLIDGREAWWRHGPFGQFLGIEARSASATAGRIYG